MIETTCSNLSAIWWERATNPTCAAIMANPLGEKTPPYRNVNAKKYGIKTSVINIVTKKPFLLFFGQLD